MSDLSILDMNLDEVQEARDFPKGWYLANTVNFKVDRLPNEKKTPYSDIEFRVSEPLDGQDLNGVNMKRPLEGRVWLTADALPITKRELGNFGVPIGGLSIKEALEKVGSGVTCKVYVDHDERSLKRGYVKPVVTKWQAV